MSTVTLNIDGFATLIAYLGMAFLVGFWLVKSRTFTGLLFTAGGVLVIWLAERSDRKPEHLAGLLVSALVIGGLLLATWALVRSRNRNRIHRVSARGAARYVARIERERARAGREAARAERNAPEIPASTTRQHRAASPAQRAPRQRSGYVVNRGKRATGSKARAASLK
jgi:hypothetical protein